jgi:hypothetical protein
MLSLYIAYVQYVLFEPGLGMPCGPTNQLFQMPGQGPASYLDAAQREKALQSMQQMSSAQIVSATSNMHSRMVAPPVSYGGFWQHPGLGGQATQDVKPFAQSPFLHGDKTPTSLGKEQALRASCSGVTAG